MREHIASALALLALLACSAWLGCEAAKQRHAMDACWDIQECPDVPQR